ncbi:MULTISPECIES: helix-turn-helix transcriptional regulator [Nocardia]|uniref:helix-turn-helix domain-containing protein n=1 Tax=Nocardia TaxID=1817 RepID=UPI00135C61D6|nr:MULTISPECIES: helix-turn-helix transcriptional regulator [Nocardia]
MTPRLDYQWHLRTVMATRGLFQTTDLRPLLAERGIALSASQVFRLVTERPERINVKILVALMDILDCRMEELIEPVAVRAQRQRRTGSGHDSGSVGDFRPKRARIAGTEP